MMDFGRMPPGFNTVTGKAKYEGMAAKLLERSESVARYLLPMGRKEGHEWVVGSLDGEKGKSLKVNLKKGVWSDFAGQPGGKDLLALWADKRGVKMHVALDEAAEWLGEGKTKTTTPPTATPPWVPTATPAQLETEERVARELSDIAQQHRTDTPHEDRWWDRVEPIKYEYFDGDGELWATVLRWDNPDPSHTETKRVRPWNHKTETRTWPEGQRPLYENFKIKMQAGPVLLVEGEKCAEALIALGFCATTIAGGSKATGVADWSPLKGRDVIRWPDNDAAGAKWTEDTRVELEKVGVKSIRDVAIPADKPGGWDCADAAADEARALIDDANGVPATALPIAAKPLSLPFASDVRKRRFVYDTVYQRGKVSITAGEGGSGKSALHVVEALCIATGRDLHELGKKIERCNVWMISLEDDEEEMHRRILGAMMHFNIDRSEIEGSLFLTTKDDAPDFLLAASDRDGFQVSVEALSALKEEIAKNDIGVVMIDPYVFLHNINENDNMGQGAVMKALSHVAGATNCAVAVVHHSKKPAANDRGGPSSSDMRGASSIVNASRHGRMVITMSAADADRMGVDKEKRAYYFYTASVKTSYSPPGHHSKWFKLWSVTLPNGTADEDGDGVGVVTRWIPPDPFRVMGVTLDTLRAVQVEVERAFSAGTPYRVSSASKTDPWIGEAIGAEAGLDPKTKEGKNKIQSILRAWMKSGALIEDGEWRDEGRRKRPIIRSGPTE